jgi:hypothetical protein
MAVKIALLLPQGGLKDNTTFPVYYRRLWIGEELTGPTWIYFP